MELSVQSAREMLRQDVVSKTTTPSPEPPALAISAPLPPFEAAWGFTLDEGAVLTRTEISKADGLAFFGDDRRSIFAVDLQSGKLRWRYRTAGTRVEGGESPVPATPPRVLGRMRMAIGPTSGRYSNQPEIRLGIQFVVSEGRLLVLTDEGVECLRTTDGSLLWRSAPDGQSNVQEALVPQSRMAVAGSRVYFWRPIAGRVSAMDRETGRLLWETEVPQPAPPPVNPNNPWQHQDAYARLRSGLSVDQGRVLAWGQSAVLLNADTGAMLWRTGTGELPGFPLTLETQEERASVSPTAPSTTLMKSVPLTTTMAMPGGMLTIGGMPRYGATQHWAYTDTIRRLLHAQGGIAPSILLRGDEVWGFTSNGESVVTMHGLPVAGWGNTGAVVGFVGRRIVNDMGSSITVTTVGTAPILTTLFPSSRSPGSASPSYAAAPTIVFSSGYSTYSGQQYPTGSVDPVTSASLAGSRVYSATPEALRAADIRSGATLFDQPWPKDVIEWRKAEVSRTSAQVMPILPGMGGPVLPAQYRRTYVPQGVFLQDQRGGGILCGPLAAVSEDLWIAPLHDRAVICLRGQFQKPVATTAPVNATPVSVR
jgi:hypothetical protein